MSENPTIEAEITFAQAVDALLDNRRITKNEWKDKRTYGIVKDGLLCIHKAGEAEDVVRPWILSDADLMGEDFIIL